MDDWKMILSKKDAKQFGPELIEAAKEERKKRFGKVVLEQIQELMSQKSQTQFYIEKAQREIDMYDKRLAAIESGKFQAGYDGKIIYNDKELN